MSEDVDVDELVLVLVSVEVLVDEVSEEPEDGKKRTRTTWFKESPCQNGSNDKVHDIGFCTRCICPHRIPLHQTHNDHHIRSRSITRDAIRLIEQ